jgi:Cof subfamily protein (haloacid dehalogenase superfamily)
MYKLAAFDMDETMLRPDGALSDYAAGVLHAVGAMGVRVVPCTGRPYGGVLGHLGKIGLDTAGIFCNGAQTRGTLGGEILDERPVPVEEAVLAARMGQEAGAHTRVYMDDRVYVSRVTEEDREYIARTGSVFEEVGGDLAAFLKRRSRGPLKVMNVMSGAEALRPFLEKCREVFAGKLHVTQSMATFVEYMRTDATKGNGLRNLAERWGIGKEEIVAAGDHLNDLSMFAEAGFSIAPANAQPSVLAAASCVCGSNAEDGVARQFSKIFGLKI